MANLNTRYPNLYLTSNCSYCNQYENTEHLLSCTLHSINLPNLLQQHITEQLQILKITNISSQIILQILIFNYNSQNSLNILLLLIQGTIPTTCFDQTNILHKKLTTDFFTQLSNLLLLWFNNKIWKDRNQKQHEWETARGISKKTKKQTKIIYPLQTSNTINNHTSYNSNIDNYIYRLLLQNFSLYNCFF